jgi:flagellar biosynthetic protein FliP
MKKSFIILLIAFFLFGFSNTNFAQAKTQQKVGQTITLPNVGITFGNGDETNGVSTTLELLLLLTILSLAPSIMIMTTSYLRIIIVFNFLKTALGTMQSPPNQLLAGIALFITFYIMAPTWNKVYDDAIKPYMAKEIPMDSAYTAGMEPIRNFMFRNVKDEDLELFLGMAKTNKPSTKAELPTYILIPAFVVGELRAGFVIGFFLFVPFVMMDMIIASILMSMGMMMLPPTLISMPFKILLFILVNGWDLIISSLVRSFQ